MKIKHFIVLAVLVTTITTLKPMASKNTDPVSFYQGNELVTEVNPSFGSLQFLYTNRIGKIIRNLIARRWLGHLAGMYKSSWLSKSRIQPFIKAYDIDMSEYEIPEQGYASFNDFFIRKFKPGARSIGNGIVSPADSKLYVIPNISTDTLFFVKHKSFNLEKFLGSKELADYYRNGTLIIFRLAPYDYHRFHFPVDCIPSEPLVIRGILESVNPIVFKNGIQPLTENERHVILLKTEHLETIAMVPVGATLVGKIVETYQPNQAHKKGDETGYFAFGGSTVVLLFKQGATKPAPAFLQHSLQGYETAVKMGEVIST